MSVTGATSKTLPESKSSKRPRQDLLKFVGVDSKSNPAILEKMKRYSRLVHNLTTSVDETLSVHAASPEEAAELLSEMAEEKFDFPYHLRGTVYVDG